MRTTKKEEKKVDVFLLLKDFQRLIKKKPPVKKMVEEIMMMGLKIKPVLGDISLLDLSNKKSLRCFGVWVSLMIFFKLIMKNFLTTNFPSFLSILIILEINCLFIYQNQS